MKILIIHTAFIGDIVLSTPLIQRLKDMYPHSKIDYVTLPGNTPVINNNPNLNEIIIYDKKGKDKGIKGFFRVLGILKKNKYDYAVIPHRFMRSAALAKLAKIPKTVGFDVSTGAWLLKEKRHYDMKRHEVERLLDLVDYKGPKIPIRLYPSEGDYEKIKKILRNKEYEKLTVIAPGSQRPEKIWPVEKYRELVERLLQSRRSLVVLTGGNKEKSLPLNFSNEKNLLDLRGEITLSEFAALLSETDVIVSNDSSPIHMGSGFEKPFIIGIFGPGKRSLGFFPWSDKSIVIEDNDFYENNMENIPERQHKYTKNYYKSIPLISVDRVYGEVVRRLEQKKADPEN